MAEEREKREYPSFPMVAVGAVVIHGGKLLMVRRGLPPGAGLWSIPGGRVELGETLKEAVEREVLEETGLIVRAQEPVFSFEIIDRNAVGEVRFHYVIIDLAAELAGGVLQNQGGDDAREARWVSGTEFGTLNMSEMTRELLRKKFPDFWKGEPGL